MKHNRAVRLNAYRKTDAALEAFRGRASSAAEYRQFTLNATLNRAASTVRLACGTGESNTAIAKRMGLTGMTVGKWRRRYREFGIEGLHDELRPGRPRTYEDDKVAEVINRALQTKPSDGSTHWSARSLAAETGISKSTVHRWLKIFALQPHRQKNYRSAEA